MEGQARKGDYDRRVLIKCARLSHELLYPTITTPESGSIQHLKPNQIDPLDRAFNKGWAGTTAYCVLLPNGQNNSLLSPWYSAASPPAFRVR
jgi:hypothetical protein